ncbi:hypothetical protein Sjap_016554 [Stephania japonica]|uniref:Uncharacterized protein n=1 Tax=Stephania japonica TaxID=461633 RepID=A0AAP0NRY6_9MAGN
MDLVHLLMNLIVPPILLTAIVVVWPFYFIYNIVASITKAAFSMEDVTGKVVLITGASSGIGEYLAYEYAKRGARLALVARREKQLEEVAKRARAMGSPDVIISSADVSNFQHCKRFVEEAVNHFGRLDHLVNNAGILSAFFFEEASNITNAVPVMDINFWGSVYVAHFALPHLKKTKGKIVANTSASGWLYGPDMSMYSASKAAMINFYETLRIELGSDVTITTVSLGFTESEMSQGKHLSMEGKVEISEAKRDAIVRFFPLRSVKESAEIILNGVRRGDRDVTDPSWLRTLYLVKAWRLWNEDNALGSVDANVKDSLIISEVLRCIHVGLLRVQQGTEDRPSMAYAIFMLGSDTSNVLYKGHQ